MEQYSCEECIRIQKEIDNITLRVANNLSVISATDEYHKLISYYYEEHLKSPLFKGHTHVSSIKLLELLVNRVINEK